jgi:clan AA aspartic protease
MITGTVTPNLAAIVRVHVEDANGTSQAIDFTIDTGFTGFVSLPPAVIAGIGLPVASQESVRIADGSVMNVPVHAGVVIWDGKPRRGDFHAVGKERLLGMALLAGHDLAIRVSDGGAVSITVVP